MTSSRTTTLATGFVLLCGVLWGFYWVPVRALSQGGLDGAWGTVAITGAGLMCLLPAALVRWRALVSADLSGTAAVAVGGAAFALYSIGFIYGRVALVILLFFLTPVWSTLIGKYLMGWHTPPMRLAAIALGLAGLGVMLSAKGDYPVPRNPGEWMGLVSGLLWAISSTGIKVRSQLAPAEAAFVFAAGAFAAALALAPLLEPWPASLLLGWSVSVPAGIVWWGLSIAALMWATTRLEPARVGILLMTEVIVGAASAAVLASEHLSPFEIAGGTLVVAAGILEVWPVRTRT